MTAKEEACAVSRQNETAEQGVEIMSKLTAPKELGALLTISVFAAERSREGQEKGRKVVQRSDVLRHKVEFEVVKVPLHEDSAQLNIFCSFLPRTGTGSYVGRFTHSINWTSALHPALLQYRYFKV